MIWPTPAARLGRHDHASGPGPVGLAVTVACLGLVKLEPAAPRAGVW